MRSSIVRLTATLVIAVSAVLTMQGVAAAATPPPVTQDQAFVVAASHDFLGRAPTGAEMASETSVPLDAAAARAAVVAGLVNSPEYVQTTVGTLYSTALGRPGDAGGVAYWSHLIESHQMSVASVASALYSSPEFFSEFGQNNNWTWINVLYDRLLSRDGTLDPSGVNYWTTMTQQIGRSRVAYSLYQSSESRHDRVAALYQDLLGRAPDGAGWHYWSEFILHHDDLNLAAALASSDEYYERALVRYRNGTVPTAPTGAAAVSGKAQAMVSWAAPSWLGGSAITGYTVTASPGGQTCTTTGTLACTVTGLTNGASYTFVVTATNEIGTSAQSDRSAAVIPTLLGWSPSPGAVPASGTVLYLQSDAGDYVGQGWHYLYNLSNSLISVSAAGSQLNLSIRGDKNWTLMGSGPAASSPLRIGYWQGLDRSAFDFFGDGRGCNTDSTDLQIDDVVYDTSGVLQKFTMRFLQHCEGAAPALRGFFRYDASDPTTPPPPGNPTDFTWQPPAGSVPATGNFLYLQGSPGDYISGGQTYLYGPGTVSALTNNTNTVSFTTGSPYWTVWMYGQSNQGRLTTGLYTNVERAPFNNPTTGGFSVFGDGRGCNVSVSTFAIDHITYDTSGVVSSISARFVQHCESSNAPPLYGALRFG